MKQPSIIDLPKQLQCLVDQLLRLSEEFIFRSSKNLKLLQKLKENTSAGVSF